MHSGEKHMKNVMKFLKNKSGATAIEYGLIAALIAVAVIGGVTALGENANTTFETVAGEMGAAAPAAP
jgi:pilus assembly protein Flp/PilA